MTGQVETGKDQTSQVGKGQVQTSQFGTIQIRTGLVRTSQVGIICQPVTGQVWTSQVGNKSIQVLTDQVQSRGGKSIWNLPNQVGKGLVKLGQVKSTMERLSWTGVLKSFRRHNFWDPPFF